MKLPAFVFSHSATSPKTAGVGRDRLQGDAQRRVPFVSTKSGGRNPLCSLGHEKWNRLASVPAVNLKVSVEGEYHGLRV